MNKKVSIIVPAYNSEKYIKRCIESIINQSYLNIEVIVVNDGSIDHTRIICEKYVNIDNRVKLHNMENKGVSHARNIGLQLATGEYVLFIDADDWIEKDTIKIMMYYAIQKDVEVVKVNFYNNFLNKEFVNKIDKKLEQYCQKKLSKIEADYMIKYLFEESYYLNVIWGQLIKRTLIYNMSFEEELIYGEDTLFNFKVLMNAKSIFFINKAYYHYRINSNGINQNYKTEILLRKIQNLNYIYKIISIEYYDKELIFFKYLKEMVDNMLRIALVEPNPEVILKKEIDNVFFENCCNVVKWYRIRNRYNYKLLISLLKNKKISLFILYSKTIFKNLSYIKNRLKD